MAESTSTTNNTFDWTSYNNGNLYNPQYSEISSDYLNNLQKVGQVEELWKIGICTTYGDKIDSYKDKIFFSRTATISALAIAALLLTVYYCNPHANSPSVDFYMGSSFAAGAGVAAVASLFFSFKLSQLKKQDLTKKEIEDVKKSVTEAVEKTLTKLDELEKYHNKQIEIANEMRTTLEKGKNENLKPFYIHDNSNPDA